VGRSAYCISVQRTCQTVGEFVDVDEDRDSQGRSAKDSYAGENCDAGSDEYVKNLDETPDTSPCAILRRPKQTVVIT
jgi:hypothetical protein